MYRPDEMAIMLEEAKQYTDSKQLGRVENRVITWDGNTDGRYILSGEVNLVLVSDIPFDTDKETVKRLVAVDGDNQSIYDTFIKNVIPNDDGTVTTIYMVEIGGSPIPMIVSQDKDTIDTDGSIMKEGVYSLFFEDNYISLIETETIHQIDQKLIPLPYSVVNLTNPVPTENLTEIELSEADVEALNKAAVADKPVLFKFTYGEGAKATAFAEVVTADEGFTQFTVAIHMMAFQILSINVFYEEGNWNGLITLYSAMDAATTEET